MTTPSRLVAVTPAKVNLGLEIVRRRDDGYHELVTILQAISLFDVFEWTATGGDFEYRGPADVAPRYDLALRALGTAPDFSSWTGRLTLRKRIPAGAGLGGGSSDAGLALRLALPEASDAELCARASALGADVPFFVAGGAALATGIGAELTPLPHTTNWVVVVTPPLTLNDKTRALYSGLVNIDFSAGDAVRSTATRIGRNEQLLGPLPNAFERQLHAHPVVRYAHRSLLRVGAPFAALSGAGSSVFTVLAAYAQAVQIVEQLPRDVGLVTLARTVAATNPQPARRIAQALRGRMKP